MNQTAAVALETATDQRDRTRAHRFHLIVDVQPWGETPIDRDMVGHLLTEIPPLIDMRILAGPHVVEGAPYNPGVSGFDIIDFSHISIHTFTEFNQLMVDVFSCKEFSRSAVVDYLTERLALEPEQMDVRTVSWE